MSIDIKEDIRYLKGVGEIKAGHLNRLGIFTAGDLLTYFPLRYEDRRNIQNIAMVNNDETALIKGVVTKNTTVRLKNRRILVRVIISDNTGVCSLLGFNQPYLKDVLKVGATLFVHGKFIRTGQGLKISGFTYEEVKADGESSVHVGRIVPVYPLTSGISQKWLRRVMYDTLENSGNAFSEYLPENILRAEKIYSINRAIKNIHFPEEMENAYRARKRMILGEFFLFQTALAIKKINTKKVIKNRKYKLKRNFLTPFKEKLGFEFTGGQKRVINEIFGDLLTEHPMNRLLQGEVGSGKTVVAISAILLGMENSYLGVVIAPTEILAEQHYLTFKSYLDGLGVNVELLTGNMKKSLRDKILQDIKTGKTDIVVGTHALLQDDVDLSRAGIMVIDEQHRFGVEQKAALSAKSESLDILAMSATPIPRTLAMCDYGDLDISTIKELPKNRKKPITEYASESKAYNFALKELSTGNFVYIVHPLIEDSDKNEWKSAQERFKEIGDTIFRNYRCGLLHGRMSGKEKEEVMLKFSNGEYRVLFTTTVIEVGIDVPKATVMIIENFNRYGLATLHQLRGRIVRSYRQPYCFLTGNITTPESKKRLNIILSTYDGFRIAEQDLKLRGAGELFGTKQHGIMVFKIGDPVVDFKLLEKARKYAFELTKSDSRLQRKEHCRLKKMVLKEYGHRFHLADVG